MVSLKIDIPPELDSKHVDAISEHVGRLEAASVRADLSDIVGCAKELAESIARVVLGVRGRTPSDKADYRSIVTQASRAVERQPGEGLAGSDEAVRKMAQSAKGLVSELGQLRNAVGTGHGRATLPSVVEEHARVATDAVVVWARWILGRLPSYLLSDVYALIGHLDGGMLHKGYLTARLEAVDLSTLEADEARALGVAVGRRTVGETFLARIEGVDPVVLHPGRFPAAYRARLVRGLLFNDQGALSTRVSAIHLVVDLLLVDDRLDDLLGEIAPLIESSGWIAPPYGSDRPNLNQATSTAMEAISRFPANVRSAWEEAWMRRAPEQRVRIDLD